MTRLARIVYPGVPHHVTHRGNRRQDIFTLPADRAAYLDDLRAYATKAELDIWAWCLMTNHVHLLAVPRREDSLARGVGLAHRRHAVRMNRREGWTGHLWANRYFSTSLDEAHLWACVRYIELNPVRAGLAERAEEWPWSSARAHCGLAADSLLSPDRPFPGDIADWSRWLREPWDGRDEAALADDIRRCTKSGRPCGDKQFVDWLEERLRRPLRPAKRGRKSANPAIDNLQGELF